MPKIIKNVQDQLILEAKRQISEQGYKNTTIRSVASACNIAVGTVYNYFSSKDMLIASFILQDWMECVKAISDQPKECVKSYVSYIYHALREFENKYSILFSDKDAKVVFATAFSERHSQLRGQIADLIFLVCPNEDRFLSEFVAEALLTWTMAGKEFEEIYALLPNQIKN